MRPFFLFLLVACGGSEPEVSTSNAPANPPGLNAPANTPDPASNVEGPAPEAKDAPNFDKAAVLAKADLADGTEDKVVEKCAGCGLGMPGDAAHSIEHEGYALHMCTAVCKENAESDLDGTLAKLN
jgi:hypothetical protein